MATGHLLQKWLFGLSETGYHENVMKSYGPNSLPGARRSPLGGGAPHALLSGKRLIGPPPRNHMIHILLKFLISPSRVRIWQNRSTVRTGHLSARDNPNCPRCDWILPCAGMVFFLLCRAFPGKTPLKSWISKMAFASNWPGAGISPGIGWSRPACLAIEFELTGGMLVKILLLDFYILRRPPARFRLV